MENENTIIKSKWNKDLLYSFVFVVLAWVTLWYGGSISGIFDPILNLPFMAKPSRKASLPKIRAFIGVST